MLPQEIKINTAAVSIDYFPFIIWVGEQYIMVYHVTV